MRQRSSPAVAARASELEGEERQHGRQRGQRARAREAGLRDRAVDTVAPHPGQQTEHAGSGLALEGLGAVGGKQDAGGRAHSRRRAGEALGTGAPRQALEALVLEHLLDHTLAGGARLLGVEPGPDVGHGEVALAQGDDALAEAGCGPHGGAPLEEEGPHGLEAAMEGLGGAGVGARQALYGYQAEGVALKSQPISN